MKLAATLLVPVAALTLAACGSSEQSPEQAAVNSMCKARADIHDQVATLSGMVRAPGTPANVASVVSSIRDDVATIKRGAQDLRASAQQNVATANDTFNGELQRNAPNLSAASVAAGTRFDTARQQLAAAEKNLELPVNC